MSDYNQFNDQQIADLIRSDNEAAFKFVYDKYWEKIFFVGVKRLNDEEEAEEAVQDIFINLWRRRSNLVIRVSFESYLAGAMKYEVIKKRAARLKMANALSALPIQSAIAETGLDLYDTRLLQERLTETIHTLPEKCQLVFVMSRTKGLSNKAIASELNISEKTVEKHITSALKVIKGRFGRYLYLVILLKGLI